MIHKVYSRGIHKVYQKGIRNVYPFRIPKVYPKRKDNENPIIYHKTEVGEQPDYVGKNKEPKHENVMVTSGLQSCLGVFAEICDTETGKLDGIVGWHFVTTDFIRLQKVGGRIRIGKTNKCVRYLEEFKKLVKDNRNGGMVNYYLYMSTPPGSNDTTILGYGDMPQYKYAIDFLEDQFQGIERVPSTGYEKVVRDFC